MDPIQEAIEYIESREAGDKFSYCQVAQIFGVALTALSRKHRGARVTQAAEDRRNLNPQQEDELIGFIEGTIETVTTYTKYFEEFRHRGCAA
jgi:hypothetical protein